MGFIHKVVTKFFSIIYLTSVVSQVLIFFLIALFLVKKSELQIWSLRISDVQRIPARNCVLAFLKHDQSTQYG